MSNELKIVITGGCGFIGNRLVRELERRGGLAFDGQSERPIGSIVAADARVDDEARAGLSSNTRFEEGDIADLEFARRLVGEGDGPLVVFHLAAMLSGEGEKRFDDIMRVNFDATRQLMELCRARPGPPPRFVFASSIAIFGGPYLTPVVSDETKPVPQTTYGTTKLMGELLVNDYSRKGFLDGRAARLPTIFIRPKPSAAASSFASNLFSQPLAGQPCALPVSREQEAPLLGYRSAVAAFVRLAELEGELLGQDRALTLPSSRYRVSEMIETLQSVASQRGLELGPIEDAPDETIQAIVAGWPVGTDASRAESLGIQGDPSLEAVIEAYIEDFVEGP